MSITLHKLMNVTNAIYLNSEPLDWIDDAEYIYLRNRNDRTEYRIHKHAIPYAYQDHCFIFYIPESCYPLYLEFFKEVPLQQSDL